MKFLKIRRAEKKSRKYSTTCARRLFQLRHPERKQGLLKKERTKKQKITINAKISYNSKKYIDYAKIVNIITTLLIKKKIFISGGFST